MTKQERVSKYMKILDNHGEGNSSWNWEILDELTDNELFDENKILEKISIIQKHQIRIENNPNKYSEDVMEYVRQRWGLKKYDDSKDKEINQLSPNEVLEHVCNWNGLLGYSNMIKSWIRDIYKLDLDNLECS